MRQALAERIALMLLAAAEPALATLKLVDYGAGVDWDDVLRSGVEVIQAGCDEGNRILLSDQAI